MSDSKTASNNQSHEDVGLQGNNEGLLNIDMSQKCAGETKAGDDIMLEDKWDTLIDLTPSSPDLLLVSQFVNNLSVLR